MIGGASVYAQSLGTADRIYLTQIHHEFDGDARLPTIDEAVWNETVREDHPQDAANPFPYSFMTLEKR